MPDNNDGIAVIDVTNPVMNCPNWLKWNHKLDSRNNLFAFHTVHYLLKSFYHYGDSVKSQNCWKCGYRNIHKNYKGEYMNGWFGKRTCYLLISFFFPLFSPSTPSVWRKGELRDMFKILLVRRPLPCTLVVDLQVMIPTSFIWDDWWLNCFW